MTRPQVADGGEGLQIWRVAANILLNKQWQTDDKGCPPAWVFGVGLTTHHCRKVTWTWTDFLAGPKQLKKT
jgi:hypothetical protein